MNISNVLYPQMRQRLETNIKHFFDKGFYKILQEKNHSRSLWYYHLQYSVELFFDELNLLDRPEAQIGYILVDEREVKKVFNVAVSLSNLIEKIGVQKPDQEYFNSSLWKEVVQTAKKAYPLLKLNDKKMNDIR